MGGKQTIAEGLPLFRVSTILEGAAPANSLESGIQINTLQQGALVWVDDEKAMYRWDEDSSQTDDNVNVVTPTGVTGNGRFIKVGSPADVWGAGTVRADTIAALNALPAFSADTVFLQGLVDAEDQNGGCFKVVAAGGLTADNWDIISLTGVHAPKQLVRFTSGMGSIAWLNTAGGTVNFAAQDTPVFSTIPHIGLGQGPWVVTGTTQFRWGGTAIPDSGFASSAVLVMNILATGTAGDLIRVGLAEVSGAAYTFDASGGIVASNGELMIAIAIPYGMPLTNVQLTFENRTNNNSITVQVTAIQVVRVPGNQETFYP